MIMNLHPDEPNVVSTMSISKSRDNQPAGLPDEQTPIPSPAIPSYAIDRDDSKLPFAMGMNNSSYSLSTILSSLLEQQSSLQTFHRPIRVEHELLSSPSTLQQQISTLNNSELLQLLLHQNIHSSSLFHRDGGVDSLGLGVHNMSNPASSIPSLSMLKPTSTLGKARECGNPGLRVLCPARGMPADHDFERAHFTITLDMKHGEELRCSHPACQAGGVKFCYCAICKKPAAKRNFRGRHHHIEDDPRVDTRNDFSERLQRDEATMSSIASAPQESLFGSTNNLGAVASQGKEQFSGARDSIVMACRARGMPSDHNSKTAYFVISQATHHGEDLECSYESCKVVGTKFSFCARCRVPVAKRGFKAHCLQAGHDGDSVENAAPNRQSSEKNFLGDASGDENANILSKDRMEKWDMLLERRPSKDQSELLASWIKQVFDVSSIDRGMEQDHGAKRPSEITGSEEEVITALIDSVVSNLETSTCYSNDLNPKPPKKRKISY